MVRVEAGAHEELQRLQADVRAHGWRHFGIERQDTPTAGAIIAAALTIMRSKAAAPF